MKKLILLLGITIFLTQFAFAQLDKNSELYKTIISKDKLLFDIGFNTCEVSQFENLLSDKFEFFHDKSGISDKKDFISGLRNGLCKSPDTYQSRRELLVGSTAIYPLYNKDVLYGAIQMGVHQFYEKMSGKEEVFGSTAKFTHYWQLENGKWKLTKSFSYDHQTGKSAVHKTIEKRTNEIFDSLVRIRRDLHKYPETSGQEKRTSKIIEAYLLNLGLEVKTNIGGFGVVGILNGGKQGRKIAWRADMDALRTDAPDKADFKSQNEGIRHICGHDVHTAIGLGIASVLAKQKEEIAGTVYFIFQPAEETFKGAKAMIDDGLFNMIKPDEIYGTHIFPVKAGVISSRPGELFAYGKTVKIRFKLDNNDAELKILVNSIVQNLRRNKPDSEPWQLSNITNSEIGLENPQTIYKDYLIAQPNIRVSKEKDQLALEFTFFETNKNNLESILLKIKERILQTKHKNSLISVEYSGGNPTVVNDKELTETALETINRIYGDESITPIYGQVPYFNEDFAYFQQNIPGVLFFLGGSNFQKNLIAMPHSPDFAVDEEAIRFGVQRFSSLILERTNSK